METSLYQSLKLNILSLLDLSKDSIHIHLGLLVFFIFLFLFKKKASDSITIVPVIVLACFMGTLDLYDDYSSLGYFRLGASVHDLINTMFWPVSIVLMVKIKTYNKCLRRDAKKRRA